MNALNRIRTRNRLLSALPWITRLTEWRRLIQAGASWRHHGWTAPVPYFVRRATLLTAARKIQATQFVETGTYRGDTTLSLMAEFSHTITIEVQPDLARLAAERFAKFPQIKVIEGDSVNVLTDICTNLKGPTLFYLDGHDSGGITGKGEESCPVLNEVKIILETCHVPLTIVIDDARLFGTDPSYPSVESVSSLASRLRTKVITRVENDAIFLEFP